VGAALAANTGAAGAIHRVVCFAGLPHTVRVALTKPANFQRQPGVEAGSLEAIHAVHLLLE
ncbi:hypothetical protein, partial [Pseudomonas sp. AFG_SD02_1510_Pfu_092]|uniref:hypothetical protein n=1 Tax=Pseudomonas sp. AFG_SD02_1510_Pfu_092 TaxID=2259497 RepID=UPI0019D430DD